MHIERFRIVIRIQWRQIALRISIGSFSLYPFTFEWGRVWQRFMLFAAVREGSKIRALFGITHDGIKRTVNIHTFWYTRK